MSIVFLKILLYNVLYLRAGHTLKPRSRKAGEPAERRKGFSVYAARAAKREKPEVLRACPVDKEKNMAKNFPVFLDISKRKINVYGAGRIASRRVETLLAFAPFLTVFALEASEQIRRAAADGRLVFQEKAYEPGSIPLDIWMVLAATDDSSVNEEIYRECREKGILVNVCSNREHCDFQFPGIASRGDLVIGINAGGSAHRLARAWTDRIRKEVEEDGYDNQAEKASHNGES